MSLPVKTFVASTALPASDLNTYLTAPMGTIQTALNGGRIPLNLGSCLLPISGVAGAVISQVESSAASPKPNNLIATFGSAAASWLMWENTLPGDYIGTPILFFYWYSTITTGNLIMTAQIAAISDTDATVTAKSFHTANSATVAVPGSAGTVKLSSIALTNNDSWAINDRFTVGLCRPTGGSDTVAGAIIIATAFIGYAKV